MNEPRSGRRRILTTAVVLLVGGGFLALLVVPITRQTAVYLPDRRVVRAASELRTMPAPGTGVLWFYRETARGLPDAATATAFAIEIDPSRLTAGTTIAFSETDPCAKAIRLHAPAYRAFSVAGTLEVVEVAPHSVRVRVRLSRNGLPPPWFPTGAFSFLEEIEFRIEEGADEDIHVNEWL